MFRAFEPEDINSFTSFNELWFSFVKMMSVGTPVQSVLIGRNVQVWSFKTEKVATPSGLVKASQKFRSFLIAIQTRTPCRLMRSESLTVTKICFFWAISSQQFRIVFPVSRGEMTMCSEIYSIPGYLSTTMQCPLMSGISYMFSSSLYTNSTSYSSSSAIQSSFSPLSCLEIRYAVTLN